MAHIVEDCILVNLSKLMKGDGESSSDSVLTEEMMENISEVLEGAIGELINDPAVIVEVKTIEKP